jgi:putative membrane protein
MMMWYGGGSGWASWILMAVGMVAFWALIITSIILAVEYLRGSRHSAAPPIAAASMRPEEILNERLARGEIDETEYQDRLTLLHKRR